MSPDEENAKRLAKIWDESTAQASAAAATITWGGQTFESKGPVVISHAPTPPPVWETPAAFAPFTVEFTFASGGLTPEGKALMEGLIWLQQLHNLKEQLYLQRPNLN